LPDKINTVPESGWLSDKIVSSSPNTETPFRHEVSGLRLDRNDPYLRLQFVHVFVRDQERSLRFFVDQLGFSVAVDVRFASGNRWVVIAPPDGTGNLALVQPTPGLDEERFIGHSGLVTFITADVEAKYREWSDRGVRFTLPPQTPGWGGVFCRFEDLDGNSFSLVEFDEVTREIEAQRRAFSERMEAERRAAQELEIAKQVQSRLFPQRLPLIPALDYAGVCLQARSVGGDYYDFLDLGGGRIALIIGDIAGKGIAAALLMANLQANLRSQYVSAIDHPEQLLGSVNRLLFENTAATAYASLFFGDYDHRSGHLRYANCGHLSGLVLRGDGGLDRLDSTCMVVGLFENWQCSMAETQLDDGDILVLYTDGVTESFNGEEEEYGEDRLIDSLRKNCRLPATDLASAIVDDVLRFSAGERYDDITLILAKRVSR
jgi:phosphoserine phosphatase RsbU/P